MEVRAATPADRTDVVGVLDAGLLDVDLDALDRRVEAGTVLVAAEEGRVFGALVAADGHVHAVAVRPRRRGQGVGSALVREAAARWGRLTADFAPRVRPFYESLCFRVEERDGRLWGVRPGPTA